MNRRTFSHSLAAGCLAVASGAVTAQEKEEQKWGNLTATFVLDGPREEPKAIAFPKGPPPGVKLPLFDDSLLVDPLFNRIENIVVWLFVPKDAKAPPIHPSFAELVKEPARLEFSGGQLTPRIRTLYTGQELVVKNTDPIGYALKGDLFRNMAFMDLVPVGGEVKRKFDHPESRPTPLSCGIHPWVNGYQLIRSDPYMGVSATDGTLTIKNVPVGTHSFVCWQERWGWLKDITRDGQAVQLKQGKMTIEIKPGDNDLGLILCKPR